jgi:hypothetical protein
MGTVRLGAAAPVFALAALATSFAVGGGQALGAAAVAKKCSVAKAGGHSYTVSAIAVSCSFADTWVSKLAGGRLKPHSVNIPIAQGPPGFQCRAGTKAATDTMPDVQGNVQISGNCAKGAVGLGGFGNSPYFNWVVVHKI